MVDVDFQTLSALTSWLFGIAFKIFSISIVTSPSVERHTGWLLRRLRCFYACSLYPPRCSFIYSKSSLLSFSSASVADRYLHPLRSQDRRLIRI